MHITGKDGDDILQCGFIDGIIIIMILQKEGTHYEESTFPDSGTYAVHEPVGL